KGRETAAAIYLAGRLLSRSSDLPEGHNGPDRSCPHIWSCSRWGLPSQPVTRLLVGSYIKGPKSPHLFTLTPLSPRMQSVGLKGRYTFFCTFPTLAAGGRYPPPCPLEPGLSSPRFCAKPQATCTEPGSDRLSGLQTDVHYTRFKADNSSQSP